MPRAAKAPRARRSPPGRRPSTSLCISRTMGPEAGDEDAPPLVDTLVALAARAGVPVLVPPDAAGTCCGVPFSSKGYAEAHALAANRAIERFWRWSDGGRLPVFVDTSPCTYGLLHAREALTDENRARFDALTILDGVAFVHDVLLPRLAVTRKEPGRPPPRLLPRQDGPRPEARGPRARLRGNGHDPQDAGCCGFAGDRGFLFPELTASATRLEAAEVREAAPRGTGRPAARARPGSRARRARRYRSFVHLVERATRPLSPEIPPTMDQGFATQTQRPVACWTAT